ncbi:hypothetical protein F5890DRAFT_1539895 [Lentinula detonsa]|uniref:N-acetyltransferase domain-containing protein n=1 Tax=Lentinula detonsa TaxID=2804962 RepID=A0AA38PS42_9AGAR|nr:hypothetical protein F5890DRAFT_1539895 [Lentinula detonsa]
MSCFHPSTMEDSEILFTPFNFSRGGHNFLVREASSHSTEIENIAWLAAEAFLDDMVINYFSGSTEIPTSVSTMIGFKLYQFYCVMFKACMLSRGRVIVVESLPEESNKNEANNKNNIAAAAAWYGPQQDVRVIAALRAGVLTPLRNYGPRLLKRIGEFNRATHATFTRAFNKRALRRENAWYLQCIFTAKQFEGQGLMSALVREGFNHALKCSPSGLVPPVILESSSGRSRSRYLHLGFEIIEPWCNIGKGKVDSRGCRPAENKNFKEKAELVGIKFSCMVIWDCRKSLQAENHYSH